MNVSTGPELSQLQQCPHCQCKLRPPAVPPLSLRHRSAWSPGATSTPPPFCVWSPLSLCHTVAVALGACCLARETYRPAAGSHTSPCMQAQHDAGDSHCKSAQPRRCTGAASAATPCPAVQPYTAHSSLSTVRSGHHDNCSRMVQGGKGSGKQKQQKQSAIPQAGSAMLPWRRPEVIMHNLLLVESFSRIVGRSEPPCTTCSQHNTLGLLHMQYSRSACPSAADSVSAKHAVPMGTIA